MPTERIGDVLDTPCDHPQHFPPQHQVFPAGRYKHTCPGCGRVMYFVVRSRGGKSCVGEDPVR